AWVEVTRINEYNPEESLMRMAQKWLKLSTGY
ncbi:MAG: hypothetical protein ACI8XX_002458, partial [Polaribacter sp.]